MSKSKGRVFSSANSLPLSTKSYEHFLADIQKLSRHNSLPPGCVDAGHGLRSIYQHYLDQYERNQRFVAKAFYLTDEQDCTSVLWDLDYSETEPNVRPPAKVVAFSHADMEHIPNNLRESWNLSIDLIDKTEYDLLELSLLSNLPNEIELTLNTTLLMSSQPNAISFYKNPKLLNLLLFSVGILDKEFWDSYVVCDDGVPFLSPHAFERDFDYFNPKPLAESQLLSAHDMAYGDTEAFRVHLVATIIRNLAVDDGLSAMTIGRHPQALRFIFLCIYSNHTTLHQIGLEILSSLHIPVIGTLVSALERLLPNLLCSADRLDRIRGLQLIKNLCTTPLLETSTNDIDLYVLGSDSGQPTGLSLTTTKYNLEFLTSLPSITFESITSALCLRDLHMAVLAVDAVYCLTSLGPPLCNRLYCPQVIDSAHFHTPSVEMPNSILLPLLMTMLNLEAQAMGSESLIRVRVMQATGSSSLNTKPTTCLVSGKPTPISTSCELKSITPDPFISINPIQQRVPLNSQIISNYVQLPRLSKPSINSEVMNLNVVNIKPNPNHDKFTAVPHFNEPINPIVCTSLTNVSTVAMETTQNSRVGLAGPVVKRDLLIQSCFTIPNPSQTNSNHSNSIFPQSVNGKSVQYDLTLLNPPIQTANSKLIKSTISTTFPTSSLIVSPLISSSKNEPNPVHLTYPNLNKQLCQTNCVDVSKKIVTSEQVKSSEDQVNGRTQLDRWEFMFEWLKSSYTVHNSSSIPRIQMYNEYQKAHQQKFGTVGVVSPIDFHSQIKSIFPGVGQIKVQVPNGSVEVHYNCLKHVDAPEPGNQGVNHIMASVLSPTGTEMNPQSPKSKNRKHSVVTLSPKLLLKCDDNVPPTKLVRYDLHETNGHSEHKLTNGQIFQTLNGVSKEVNNFGNKNMLNGPKIDKNVEVIEPNNNNYLLNKDSTANHQLPAVIFTDSRIVILPVFTTISTAANINGKLNGNTIVNSLTGKLCDNDLDEFKSETCSVTKSQISSLVASVPQTTTTTSRTFNIQTPLSHQLPNRSMNSITELLTTKSTLTFSNALNDNIFLCEWDNCGKIFPESSELCEHIRILHLRRIQGFKNVTCLWGKCKYQIHDHSVDTLRQHLNNDHLLDVAHVTDSELISAMEPNQITNNDRTTENKIPNLLRDKCCRAVTGGVPNLSVLPTIIHEGPVTKHLRLTSALALKNLLRYSESSRRYVRTWKSFLCDLAFASMDSSPTLLECLTLLTSFSTNDQHTTLSY